MDAQLAVTSRRKDTLGEMLQNLLVLLFHAVLLSNSNSARLGMLALLHLDIGSKLSHNMVNNSRSSTVLSMLSTAVPLLHLKEEHLVPTSSSKSSVLKNTCPSHLQLERPMVPSQLLLLDQPALYERL